MSSTGRTWAIVLAAGEGTRLHALTTKQGIATPKQFCSLQGGRSLLGDTLARARHFVANERIVVIVAGEHRRFWEHELALHPPANVVVQPRGRGTAAGILLPLLTVFERDPAARVVVLPSDHYVADEPGITSALRTALASLSDSAPTRLTLLGIEPSEPETGYGYVVPAQDPAPGAGALRRVARFVEKPEELLARELLACGALWNSFLFAARGEGLLARYQQRFPALLARFRSAFAERGQERAARLAEIYQHLEPADFSRDLLQGGEGDLRLVAVPPCGWTDLGTPERVAACLAELCACKPVRRTESVPGPRAALNLAEALQAWRGLGAHVPA